MLSEKFPRLAQERHLKWVVGVNTAPRRDPTLRQSVRSLLVAGWNPIIFAEPGTDVSGLPKGVEVVMRPRNFGYWHNWREMCLELLERFPDADAIMTVQDDTVFHKQSLDFVDQDLWPSDPSKVAFVSLYCTFRHLLNTPV